jgi:hypothetical protein
LVTISDGSTLQTIACLVEEVLLGVDTHLDSHTAGVIDLLGRELETRTFPTTRRGIDALIKWACLRGTVRRAGVEGTGSYGAGLAQRLVLEGIEVFEVSTPSRRGQRHRGKTDDRDAFAAARVVLSGEARAIPKTRDGIVESIRVLRNTRASAVKARTQAGQQLRGLVLTAPTELRELLRDLSTTKTVARCARWHRVDPTDTTRSTRLAMRVLARRHEALDAEVAELDTHIKALTKTAAPRLLAERGVRPETAARLLIVAGDNPRPTAQRLRTRCALRRQPRRGVKRQDDAAPPQPRRRPPRQQRALDDRQQPHDPRPGNPRLRRATLQGRQEQQRDPPMPHASHRSRALPAPHCRPPRRPNPPSLDIGASMGWPKASWSPSRPS